MPISRTIVHRRQLEAVLREYVTHDDAHRPHRALGLRGPQPGLNPVSITRSA